MYAIITDGSHQYRVEEGMTLQVELQQLPAKGNKIEFDHVLLIGGGKDGVKIGTPNVPKAKVLATVVAEVKGDKLVIQKYRPRKNTRLKKGHRQKYHEIKIDKIKA